MDKKVKFSEQPTRVKVIYGAAVAILCITAIIIGIVSVASKKNPKPEEVPPADGAGENGGEENPGTENEDAGDGTVTEKLTFTSPVVGTVEKSHSLEVPVFSNTLGDWRIHTGIDIAAAEGTEVYAAADGVVSRVWSDPFHGKSVEITHEGGIVSVYSNLSSDVPVKEGDAVLSGALIGKVGDTSLVELADEPHIHFEIKLEGVSVNPLDYISDDSKKASLGIEIV